MKSNKGDYGSVAIKIYKNGKAYYLPEAHEIKKKIDETIEQQLGAVTSILLFNGFENFPKEDQQLTSIYKDTKTNKLYQWNGKQYIEIITDHSQYSMIYGGNAQGNTESDSN